MKVSLADGVNDNHLALGLNHAHGPGNSNGGVVVVPRDHHSPDAAPTHTVVGSEVYYQHRLTLHSLTPLHSMTEHTHTHTNEEMQATARNEVPGIGMTPKT